MMLTISKIASEKIYPLDFCILQDDRVKLARSESNEIFNATVKPKNPEYLDTLSKYQDIYVAAQFANAGDSVLLIEVK